MATQKIETAAAQAAEAQETCEPVGVQPANPRQAGCDYDVLQCASLAVLMAECDDYRKAEAAYLEATVAAMDAFPPGPLADALNLVLAVVGGYARGVAA